MKTIPMAAGLAMALALVEPGMAAEPVPSANPPCPILRPMARCLLEARRVDTVAAVPGSRRLV